MENHTPRENRLMIGLARVLFSLRYMALAASLFLALSALFLTGVGIYKVLSSVAAFGQDGAVKTLSVHLVSGAELFFISLTLLILSLGVFELFVLRSGQGEGNWPTTPPWLSFNSIDDLKDTLTKLIVVVLIVAFFEILLERTALINESWEMLVVPAGILMIAGAWRLMK